MKPLLLFPSFFRPNDAGGQIARHFFQNLHLGEDVHVICSDKWEIPNETTEITIHALAEVKGISSLDKLFRIVGLRDFYNSPDYFHYSFSHAALKKASELIRDGKVDFIHTINNPVSSHLLGIELKKKYQIPWVAQLYDPWFGNPYRYYKTTFFRNIDKRREAEAAKFADLILFPNTELLYSWVDTYGESIKSKVAVLPFCTEIPAFNTRVKQDSKLVISHIGSLSKERKSTHFINALASFNDRYPELAKQIQVNYVGSITPEEVSLIESSGIKNLVNFVGGVSEQECFKYYEESDLFLIVDIDCEPNLFYPSKLLKYFCYQKPIMGLTKDDSVVYHELSRTGNYPFKYDDEEALTEFLYKAVIDYESINTNNKTYGERFSVDSVCKEYIKQINKIQHE